MFPTMKCDISGMKYSQCILNYFHKCLILTDRECYQDKKMKNMNQRRTITFPVR